MNQHTYLALLKDKGYRAYIWCQFLGIINDNAYKFVMTFFATHLIMGETQSTNTAIVPAIGAVFILPYLLFSGYAGYLADAFNKRSVLIATKSMEIISMALGIVAFYYHSIPMMMVVLFFMATQSTLFSPAKYGILPEMLPTKDLSRANGLLEMSCFLAIVFGSVAASWFYTWWSGSVWISGVVFTGLAVWGTVISFGISRVPSPAERTSFKINPWYEIVLGSKHLFQHRSLWLTVVAITYFWFLGAVVQMNIIQLGTELDFTEIQVGWLFASLAAGIGLGCVMAGKMSGDRIELGYVPIGSLGMTVASIVIYFSSKTFLLISFSCALLGFAGGFFIVPLYAFLQSESDKTEKGRFLATSNFINTLGILLASGVLALAYPFGISSLLVFFGCGLLTIVSTGIIISFLPHQFLKVILYSGLRLFYRIKLTGVQNIPQNGSALLVSNHISYLDGLVLGTTLDRVPRFLVFKDYFEKPYLKSFLTFINAIPVKNDSMKNFIHAIRQAREELKAGNLVCIFAEGGLTRNGNLMRFNRGLEKIVEGSDTPIIPIHLSGLWNSVFTYNPNRRFSLKRLFQRRLLAVNIGEPMPSDSKSYQIRSAVAELGTEAAKQEIPADDRLHLHFIKTAKRHPSRLFIADSTETKFTFRKTLALSLLLSDWIKKQYKDDKNIGIMLPPSVFGVIANVATSLVDKASVNLNFTAGQDILQSTVQRCNINCILTSRRFIEKSGIEDVENLVYLEDIVQSFSKMDLIQAYVKSFLPYRWLKQLYPSTGRSFDKTATILFSSGSTGEPKGIMLSHANILSNIRSVQTVFQTKPDDVMGGVLPFFHAFGYSFTLWFPLVQGLSVAYHANPRDAKIIGKLVEKHGVTILISIPTFFQAYARRIPAEKFRSLQYALSGAEKLSNKIRQTFLDKFGLPIYEGYGCTEMSPVVSFNLPNVETKGLHQICQKEGTVGTSVPGVAAKIVDPDTYAPLDLEEEGLLFVKGPNLMQGYFQQPEKTDEVVLDGWYNTGDIAKMDEEGFISITDRLARFCKIGGEMVPLIKIENELSGLMESGSCVATSVPDSDKGEKIVVLFTEDELTPKSLWHHLSESNLPKLWLPKLEHFFQVESLPTLATGKLDLPGVKNLALHLTATLQEV